MLSKHLALAFIGCATHARGAQGSAVQPLHRRLPPWLRALSLQPNDSGATAGRVSSVIQLLHRRLPPYSRALSPQPSDSGATAGRACSATQLLHRRLPPWLRALLLQPNDSGATAGRACSAIQLSSEPLAYLYPKLIDEDEARHIVTIALPRMMRSMVGGGSVNEVRPAVPLMGGPADVIFSFSRRRYKTAGLCA